MKLYLPRPQVSSRRHKEPIADTRPQREGLSTTDGTTQLAEIAIKIELNLKSELKIKIQEKIILYTAAPSGKNKLPLHGEQQKALALPRRFMFAHRPQPRRCRGRRGNSSVAARHWSKLLKGHQAFCCGGAASPAANSEEDEVDREGRGGGEVGAPAPVY